jgi:CRP-like cAMP-binding protein
MSVAKMSKRKLRSVGRVEGVSPSLLRQYSRLGSLPVAKLERVARGSECQLIPAGNTIFTQDDDADAVYMLLDGNVSLERYEKDGDSAKHRVSGPFASFGDEALLGAPGRYYTANTDSTSIVIRTPLSVLMEVLASDPKLAEAWIHAVGSDLQRRERRLAGSIKELIAHPAFPDAA